MIREGLKKIIAHHRGWRVVGEASTADEVLPLLRRHPADVAVIDVTLGGRSGLDLLPNIRSEFPSTRVLMLSMHDEKQYAIPSLRAGAFGYIEKDSSAAEILQAIERVAAGHRYMTETVADLLALEVIRGHVDRPHDRLSTREFEVFRMIALGRTVGEIADALHLSAKTVSTYRSRILQKTRLRSNAEIVAYAIRSDLI